MSETDNPSLELSRTLKKINQNFIGIAKIFVTFMTTDGI
jgi:hypothetical protein